MSERAGRIEPQGQGKPPPMLPKPTLNVRATLDAARSTSEGLDVERLARVEAAFVAAVNAPSATAPGIAVPHFRDVERIWAAIDAALRPKDER